MAVNSSLFEPNTMNFSKDVDNSTHCEITGDHCEISTGIKILVSIEYPLVVFLGGTLHYSIAYFEFNGGDPQKRGLLNQLVSYMCLNLIFHLFVQVTSILYRVLLGPLDLTVSKILTSIQVVCMLNTILVFSEQITNRHLKIQKFKIKTKLSVEFWVRFYFIVNNAVSFIVVLFQLYTDM